ncbi:MAG: acetolactate synthase small subunit, partial [Reinekea sp.]|nr:acetolactate synthase small subunit [Reinekea sp.]
VRAAGAQREEVKRTSDIFRAQIIDVTPTTYTIMVTGDEEKLAAFLESLSGTTIMEVARTGVSGVARGEKVLSL